MKVVEVRVHDEDPSPASGSRPTNRWTDFAACKNFQEYRVTVSSSPNTDAATVAVAVRQLQSSRQRRWRRAPFRVVQDLFLPLGYPASVEDGYLQYQFYDSLQGLSSYLRGVLCSAQVLQAAGVGRAEATAWSVAMTWALKDGVSMLGGLLFSYMASPHFDAYVKEFRLFADLVNDVGLTLDMLAPYCSSLLIVSSLSGVCKTLCGLSAGATKSSITSHFSRTGNMADLNAKEATQETLVSLMGMLLGISIASRLSVLNDRAMDTQQQYIITQIQWSIFASLTIIHIWANVKGVELLRLRTLNRERAEIVLSPVVDRLEQQWIKIKTPQVVSSSSSSKTHSDFDLESIETTIRALPEPTQVHESIVSSMLNMTGWSRSLLAFFGSKGRHRIQLSSRLTDLLLVDPEILSFSDETIDQKTAALHDDDDNKDYNDDRYALVINERHDILIALFTGAQMEDQLKAFVHGLVLVRCLSSPSVFSISSGTDTNLSVKQRRRDLVQTTRQIVDRVFVHRTRCNVISRNASNDDARILSSLSTSPSWLLDELSNKGWDHRLYIGFPRHRSEWNVTVDNSSKKKL